MLREADLQADPVLGVFSCWPFSTGLVCWFWSLLEKHTTRTGFASAPALLVEELMSLACLATTASAPRLAERIA